MSGLVACGARSGLEAWDGPRDSAFPWESSIAPVRVRRPADCVQDWRTLHESTSSAPPAIAIAAGELIYRELVGNSGIAYQIRALDLAQPSRSPRVIRAGLGYEDLWLDGDRLLVRNEGQLIAVPLAGGGEEVVLDARSPDPSLPVLAMLVEQDAFYWARPGTNRAQIEIWRQARGGGSRLIASLDDGRFDVQVMAATSQSVIIADRFSGVTVPLDGAPLQPLDSVADGELAGIDGLGVYYVRAANRTLRGGRALEFEIRRAPADGAPTTRFWRRRAGHHLSRIWPADSGWLATGDYYMFDRRPHGVIAHIDENGGELLIACDRGDNYPISRPVYYEGAFYVVTRAEDDRWRIVEIRLPE